jgi:hypothetical protein
MVMEGDKECGEDAQRATERASRFDISAPMKGEVRTETDEQQHGETCSKYV